MIGIGLLAVLLGILISVSAGTAARLALVILLLVIAMLAWAMPNSNTSAKPIAWAFMIFGFINLVWPRLVSFRTSGFPALNPEKIAFFALLAVWFWVVMTSPKVRAGLSDHLQSFRPVLWALGLLVVWRVITAFAGLPAGYYFGVKVAVTELFAYYLMLVIGLSVWRKPADVRPFFWIIVLAGLSVSLIAAYEASVSRNLFSSFISFDEDAGARVVSNLSDKFRTGKYRVQAGFEHPLVLAEFLVMAIPCAIYLMVSSRRLLIKVAMFGAVAGFCLVAYRTDSRAAQGMIVLTFFLAALLFAYRSFRVSKSILGVVIGLLVPAVLLTIPLLISVMAGLIEGAGSTVSASTEARFCMLERSIPLVLANPFFGFGVGQGGYELGCVVSGGLHSVDNHFVSLALDSGLPALLAYVFAMAWFGWRLFLMVRDPQTEDGALAICLLLALVAFCGMKAILSIPSNTWLLFAVMGAMGTLVVPTGKPMNKAVRGIGDAPSQMTR